MLSKIQHVALAVADMEAALAFYKDVWGLEVSHRERVESDGIEEAMLPLGDSFLQLIAPTAETSTVAKFIERRGEGLHHIAYEVDDVAASLAQLESAGATLIDDQARRGGGGHLVAFVHPKGNHGVLVELVQRSDHA
ncbi:MAG TPA: methylmalonyl-CoA epimerase [Actinomycetota bacterium]|jgi:methylmalonyl-CoA/ethylmalonyl-CoA epimerase|nr:methylmalonyl-CoA epimerase [Actinomycetota bacterium]